jgi:EmrB/QacA subfamily drug resistance transporter
VNVNEHARRWWILAVISVAQLMVALDSTVINIALPRAQHDLGFSDSARPWAITAYALAFGSLLLLGGRLSDLWGQRNALMIGLVGFAVASAVGAASSSFSMLVTARAVQGAFGALLAPATLAILTTTFREPKERARAFAISGAIGASGAAIGLLVGGALTQWSSWRWCLSINLFFAAIALAGTVTFVRGGRGQYHQHLDWFGTLLACGGFFGVVFGLGHAVGGSSTDWTSNATWGPLAAGFALLIGFIFWQKVSRHPLLPLRIVANRMRAGSLVALFLTSSGIFGISLFLAYYLEQTLGYSPIVTGLAFMPMVIAIGFSAAIASARLLPVTGPRSLVPAGMALGAMGLVLFTRLTTVDQYWSHILPGLVVTGLGLGLVFAPSVATATSAVSAQDAGAASAAVNATQQVGGSIGVALLNTIAIQATTLAASSQISNLLHQPWITPPSATRLAIARIRSAATVHGYSIAFWWGAGIFAVGTVATFALLESGVAPIDAPELIEA